LANNVGNNALISTKFDYHKKGYSESILKDIDTYTVADNFFRSFKEEEFFHTQYFLGNLNRLRSARNGSLQYE